MWGVGGLGFFCCVGFLALLFLFWKKEKKKEMAWQQLTQRFSSLAMAIGGGGLALTTFGSSFFYSVHPGERAVLFDRVQGVKQKVYGEGLHFMVPVLQV